MAHVWEWPPFLDATLTYFFQFSSSLDPLCEMILAKESASGASVSSSDGTSYQALLKSAVLLLEWAWLVEATPTCITTVFPVGDLTLP